MSLSKTCVLVVSLEGQIHDRDAEGGDSSDVYSPDVHIESYLKSIMIGVASREIPRYS